MSNEESKVAFDRPNSGIRISGLAVNRFLFLKGQYHGRSIGDIMIFGQNSLNLNFQHCVN